MPKKRNYSRGAASPQNLKSRVRRGARAASKGGPRKRVDLGRPGAVNVTATHTPVRTYRTS